VELSDLEALIELFERSGLAEMELEQEGRRVRLTRATAQPAVSHVYAPPPPPGHAPAPPATPEAEASEPEATEEEHAHVIPAPMVGTFYTASAPGEPAFVNPGDTVEPGQTVGIVEAMKIMNEVPASEACVIEKLLVQNGEPVEYGQPLFAVRPVA